MNKLLAFAKSIEDFRMDRKKLHPVENIVFITILAYNVIKLSEITAYL